jgi:formylglycine-generating enzyme required for sulfatase activity
MSTYDVFISHASEDKKIAHAMCHFLEENGVRCWIAPRDIRHGQDYAEAIINAISEQCRVMVVVFTKSANNSPYVKSEVERAFHHGLTIISFRVEDVLPSKSLELFLGPTHWLDACAEPPKRYYSQLLRSISGCLESQIKGAVIDDPPVKASHFLQKRTGVVALVALIGLITVGSGLYLFNQNRMFESKKKADVMIAEESTHLATARGGLIVRTEPSGANVRVGALALEKSPLTLKLIGCGKYPVTVRMNGYENWVGEIEVTENGFSELSVPLIRSTGTLELTSEPSGATVLVDGIEIGTTPYRDEKVPTGEGTYQFQLRYHKPVSIVLQIRKGEATRQNVTLEELPGPKNGKAWTIPGVNLVLMPIPLGNFTMGSAKGGSDEQPLTQVQLTKDFWLGKFEVTQAQWEAVVGTNPSKFKGEELPVEQVSYDEALAFCAKLTDRETKSGRLPAGYHYTLPTEAQWEYACRAGSSVDSVGDLSAAGWYRDNGGNSTHQVGQKQANAWGLFDMQGNVCEWCFDFYEDKLLGETVTDPTGSIRKLLKRPWVSDGSGNIFDNEACTATPYYYPVSRVIRGGSWDQSAIFCRPSSRLGRGGLWSDLQHSTYRKEDVQGFRFSDVGFRLALSAW